MFTKLKYATAEKVKQNPYLWALFWNSLPRLRFLLPHDKSYFGLRHILRNEEGLILDIGANNGISAAGFRRINRDCPILSVEANAHHEPSLRRLKRTLPKFDYRILAAGRDEGTLRLHTPMFRWIPIHTHTSSSHEYMDASLSRDFSPRVMRRIRFQEHTAEVLPLDKLDLEPSLVKVDIEGADGGALWGLEQTTRRCRPVFLIEFTPGKMDEVFRFLDQQGYARFVYDHDKDTFAPLDESRESDSWTSCNLQVNLYCIQKEKVDALELPGI